MLVYWSVAQVFEDGRNSMFFPTQMHGYDRWRYIHGVVSLENIYGCDDTVDG